MIAWPELLFDGSCELGQLLQWRGYARSCESYGLVGRRLQVSLWMFDEFSEQVPWALGSLLLLERWVAHLGGLGVKGQMMEVDFELEGFRCVLGGLGYCELEGLGCVLGGLWTKVPAKVQMRMISLVLCLNWY